MELVFQPMKLFKIVMNYMVVIILVLVELVFQQKCKSRHANANKQSHNPCFSGTCFSTQMIMKNLYTLHLCHNPCFSGTCFSTNKGRFKMLITIKS